MEKSHGGWHALGYGNLQSTELHCIYISGPDSSSITVSLVIMMSDNVNDAARWIQRLVN